MRWKLIYACALVVGVLGIRLLGIGSVPSVHGAGETNEIPQPPYWVAFEADVDTVYPPGTDEPRVVGKFYRASDGSERLETQPVDRPGKVISIRNIPRATMYVFNSFADSWRSYPMDIPPTGWHPMRYRLNAYVTERLERVEGFKVYEMTNAEGGMKLIAPELNFFALRDTNAANGRTRSYANIKRVEPPSSLFLPPPGVHVEPQEQHLGIVRPKSTSGEPTE